MIASIVKGWRLQEKSSELTYVIAPEKVERRERGRPFALFGLRIDWRSPLGRGEKRSLIYNMSQEKIASLNTDRTVMEICQRDRSIHRKSRA